MTRSPRHSIGIFSRDGEVNYKWLISLLRIKMFQSVVEAVLPVYISNNPGSFAAGLSRCSFAIVYHTKKRGRLNIANVTDSLYDQELEDLSRHLGRSNVVVLVDDLEDSGDNIMRRILQEQRLDTYACELILVSEREKESSNLSGADPRFSQSPISPQMQDPYDSLYGKFRNLKDIIEDAPHNNAGLDVMDSPGETSSESSNDSRGKGDMSSVVTSTIRSNGDDSIRPPHQSGYGPHTRLVPPPSTTVTIDKSVDDERRPLHVNSQENAAGSVPQIPKPKTNEPGKRNKKKDKMVFGIIGGLIALLVIVLIIVLCVTL